MPPLSITRPGTQRIGMAAALALLGGGMFIAAPAAAGSFKVTPVQINMPADRNSASLTITNSDSAPVSVSVTAYGWTQAEGRDVHTPTSDVIFSPPMFTIPAGKTQLLRIGLRHRSGAGGYRLVLDEIPPGHTAEGQIKVLLRLNLPLYLLPKGGGKPDLSWSAWRDSAGELFIEGRNRGPVHGQVVELSAGQGGARTILSKRMGVVLPGSARQWKIGNRPDFKVGAPLVLNVRGAASETQTQILVEQR